MCKLVVRQASHVWVLQRALRGPLHAQGDALHAMELALALEKLNFQARCQQGAGNLAPPACLLTCYRFERALRFQVCW